MLEIELISHIITGVVAAVIAKSKHRNPIGWFFGGFFLCIIGIIIVAVLNDPVKEEQYRNQVLQENNRLREQLMQEKLKNEAAREYTYKRLDAHDQVLGMDTKNPNLLPRDKPISELES